LAHITVRILQNLMVPVMLCCQLMRKSGYVIFDKISSPRLEQYIVILWSLASQYKCSCLSRNYQVLEIRLG
jgi:hypothetical protein